MKKLLITLMLIFTVSGLHAEPAKKMGAGTSADLKVEDVYVAETIERNKYVLRKNGDKFEVITQSQKKPVLDITHDGKVTAATDVEKKIKDTLNAHRAKLAKTDEGKPATLMSFADLNRGVDNWISGAMTTIAPVTGPIKEAVGTFGPFASLLL